VKGPGEIIFGDDVSVIGDATPWTYSPKARIVVGNRVMMGSARFGCMQEITIGDDAILAEVSIADTDFHSTWANRHSESAPIRVAPVHVGRNAWLGQASALLPGASIGENSTVSYGAVCMRAFPANVIIIGNPAKVASPIPSGSAPVRPPDSATDPAPQAARQPRSSKPGV
jgi:acetyltransferase-like isoleucine patch superfamily enzyme